MKKILLIIVPILFFLSSCEEEEICVSNCGTITNDDACPVGYCVEIRNECSNNLELFNIGYESWSTAYEGNEMCITNVTSW